MGYLGLVDGLLDGLFRVSRWIIRWVIRWVSRWIMHGSRLKVMYVCVGVLSFSKGVLEVVV